jgi:hypothetical protein
MIQRSGKEEAKWGKTSRQQAFQSWVEGAASSRFDALDVTTEASIQSLERNF